MILNLHKNILHWFNKGNFRTIEIKKNIVLIFLIKGISIVISLLLVPLTINYINPVQYGLWLTLSSIIAWISFFDIGLGNGLRNKLTEALAKNDITLAKEYVSTAYAVVSLIFIFLSIIFLFINSFINWTQLLNAPLYLSTEINSLVIVVFLFFSLRFIFQLLLTICFSFQKPALSSLINLIGNLISLIIIWVLTYSTSGSLYLLGLVYSSVPVLVLVISSIYLFNSKFKEISPSIKNVNFNHTNILIGLALKFFIIQISGVVTFSAMNFLINSFYSSLDVTRYNISFKLFSVITMVYGIILTPFWSATTDAYHKGEISWIKNSIKKYNYLSMFFIASIIILLLLSNDIYRLWIGNKVDIPLLLSAAIAFDSLLIVLFSPYTTIINGIGKLKVVFLYVIFQTIIFIPLVYISVNYLNFGVVNILLVSIVLKLPLIFIQMSQVNRLFRGKLVGIWNE
jgi:O-antigen/teichoic acid export membrane protein